MIIAITSQGKELSSQVDERFGRAPVFILYDTQIKAVRVLDNFKGVQAASGAGTQAADFIATHGVDVLLTGNVGPKAFAALQAANLEIYSVFNVTVEEAIKRFQNNELQEMT